MPHDEWLNYGIEQGWLQATCLMHLDAELHTDEERYRFDILGEDPCIPRWVVATPD
ncbi:MAG: hypothetical protein ACO3VQ_12515 [Ilumatobacteraceae bacterium]